MSLLDDVSIVVTPNGYKAGTLYGVLPTDILGSEEVTNGDFATDSDWSKGAGWTIAGGKASNDGTSGNLTQNGILVVGRLYEINITVSNYVSGTIQVTAGAAFHGASSVLSANGTYTLLQTCSPTTNLFIVSTSFNGSIDNISVKEWTGADMDVTRATAATRVNESGLVEDILSNVPRIDYTGGGCPKILAEPQRTNLIPYSEDLTQGSTNRLSVTSNATTSPDGTNTADKLIPNNTSSTYHYFAINSLSIDSNYRYSVYLKKSEYEYALINFELSGTSGSSKNAIINLNNGNIESTNFTSVSVTNEGNGWYRCSVQATASRTSIAIYPLPSSDTGSFTGDNTSGIFAWGIQLEESSYPTSYIPTSGSSVTRNQDQFTREGIASLINDSEGVLFVEMNSLTQTLGSSDQVISISDGTTDNRIQIYHKKNLSNTIAYGIESADTGQFFVSVAMSDISITHKVAIKYKANDCALWINGSEVDTQTSVTMPSGLNKLSFDQANGSQPFFGNVKQLQIYKTALTDAQLTSLTT